MKSLGLETCLILPENKRVNPLTDELQVFSLISQLSYDYSLSNDLCTKSNVYTITLSYYDYFNQASKSKLELSPHFANQINEEDYIIVVGDKESDYLSKKAFYISKVERKSKKQKKINLNLSNGTLLPFCMPQESIFGILGYENIPRRKVNQITNPNILTGDVFNLIGQYQKQMGIANTLNWSVISEVEKILFDIWAFNNPKLKSKLFQDRDLFSLAAYFEDLSCKTMRAENQEQSLPNFLKTRERIIETLRSGKPLTDDLCIA